MSAFFLRGSSAMVLALAAASALISTPSMAQDKPNEEAGKGLADIVVTAQKREQSLQSTPIAIDVVSGEGLEARGVNSISDLASGTIPAIRATPLGGRPSALIIGMRGIVPGDATQLSRDNGVGIYIDGVNLGRVQGLGTELFEIERVEVLKGPQGTLFGRNAVGGAISIISKAPTGQLGVRAKAGVRNFAGYEGELHVDLPEFANVSLKLDGVYSKRGGTVDNSMAGQSDFGQYRRYGFHAMARWQPSADFTADISFDISRDEATPYYNQLIGLTPGAPQLPPLRRQGIERNRVHVSAADAILQPSVGKVWGVSSNATWDIADHVLLRSITAYRELDQTQYDNNGTTFTAYRPNGTFGRYSFAAVDQWQFSQEFQLVGQADRLSYVAGLYYFQEGGNDTSSSPNTMRYNADGTSYTLIPDPFVSPTLPARMSFAKARSRAVFGQMTYTPALLDERLHLTAGGRYTWDSKSGALTILNGAVPVLAGVRAPITFRFRSSRFDPMVNLAVDLSDDVHGYIKWSRAYRAGGASSRSATFSPFGEEVASTSELGLKSEFLDRKVRLNLAGYRTHYGNLQIDFLNPANLSNQETRNTNRPARIWGLEADLTAQLGRGLQANVNYSYTHVSIPPQVNPFTNALIPIRPVLTPKHAVSGAIDYETSAGPGTLKLHLDAVAQGKSFSGPGIDVPLSPRFLLNGRVTLADLPLGGGRAEVGAWMRNITNEFYELYASRLVGAGLSNAIVGQIGDPRSYGVDVAFRF